MYWDIDIEVFELIMELIKESDNTYMIQSATQHNTTQYTVHTRPSQFATCKMLPDGS